MCVCDWWDNIQLALNEKICEAVSWTRLIRDSQLAGFVKRLMIIPDPCKAAFFIIISRLAISLYRKSLLRGALYLAAQ